MGHTVSDAAARSVKKGEKQAEKAARTDAQIFVDVEKLLDAYLSVPPADIRLLLTRYKELKKGLDEITAKIAEDVARQQHEEQLEEARLTAKAELDKARPLLEELAENPAVIEAVAVDGLSFDKEDLNGSQEETASGTEERSVTRTVGTIEAIS
jgi:hypothetical protein